MPVNSILEHNTQPDIASLYEAVYPSVFKDLLGIGKEKYCRYLWSKHINPKKDRKKPSAWQAIGVRQSGQKTTDILSFFSKSEGVVELTEQRRLSLDVFVSPNQFFDWRNTKQLSQLHANWIDIDTKGHAVVSECVSNRIFTELCDALQDADLPSPTAFVSSGSGGYHLYWIYAGFPSYKWALRVWREITVVLAKALKKRCPLESNWTVDFGASKDPSRVLRLPGSIHGKSGRVVKPLVGGPVYTFSELAECLISSRENIAALSRYKNNTPYPVVSSIKHKTEIAPSEERYKDQQRNTSKHNIKDWWFKIYSNVISHGRKHGIQEGKRDFYAFILFVALQHIKVNDESALSSIKELNKSLIGLTEEELKSFLSTAIKTRYRYKKDTIADYLESNLGISSEFLFSTTSKLSQEEIKRRQSDSAKQTAAKRSSSTLEKLTRYYRKHLNVNGLPPTQSHLSEITNVSTRTVKRYWKAISDSVGTFGVCLNIPLTEVVSPLVEAQVKVDIGCSELKRLKRLAQDRQSLGPEGANLFTALCRTLVSSRKRGCFEKLSFTDIGRLSRIICSFHLTYYDSVILAGSFEERYLSNPESFGSIDKLVPYVHKACRSFLNTKVSRIMNVWSIIDGLLKGELTILPDHEYSLLCDLVDMFRRRGWCKTLIERDLGFSLISEL